MGWITALNKYLKMIQFSHTLFALPFAGIAFILAYLESTQPTPEVIRILILVLVCMVSARSAAMGFNRYVDAEIDAKNERTKNREIPRGAISKGSAIFFILASSLLFLVASFLVNRLAFLLSFPALFVLFGYSLAKRFTLFCHLILGFAISLAPIGTWIALKEEFATIPLLLSAGLLFHISGFDVLYALQDEEFDRTNGLHSIPSKLGVTNSRRIAIAMHFIAFVCLWLAGSIAYLGFLYYISLAIVLVLWLVLHQISKNTPSSQALPIQFFQVNSWVSVILFIGIFLDRFVLLKEKFLSGIY
jgi:4-hydroxybenzoate polyprenyltransferase